MGKTLRIANCSGFSGDRESAIREVLDGPPVDFITGDYLAELTIASMSARRAVGKGEGYSEDLIVQLEGCLAEIVERGIKLVVNAGGFDPSGLAARIRELAGPDLPLKIAWIEGDELLPRLSDLQREGHELSNLDTGAPLSSWGRTPSSASAYLGAWGIVDALAGGADVVICPRVTDASLTVGPAAWHHGWSTDDWDKLAQAVVVGHVIECGPQATGGNFSGFEGVAGMVRPGFPIAEIEESGDAVITKDPATGGTVTVDTVTAQILYEIQGPIYLNPDVSVDLRTVELAQEGIDRVRVSGTTGTPPPATTKVSITALDDWENSVSVFLCGLDIDAKAALVEAQVRDVLAGTGAELVRVDRIGSAEVDPSSVEAGTVTLRLLARAEDPKALAPRAFYGRVYGTILASIPGFHAEWITSRAARPSRVVEYWPGVVPVSVLEHVVVHDDGEVSGVRAVPTADPPVVPSEDGHGAVEAAGDTLSCPLGRVAHGRAGDKGGNSNIGLWAGEEAWPWLRSALTVEAMRGLMPEAADLKITRHELPRLRAVNFMLHGLLGDGGSSNGRMDALGKSFAEYVRARHLDIPRELVESGE